jgi:hypothetical protein
MRPMKKARAISPSSVTTTEETWRASGRTQRGNPVEDAAAGGCPAAGLGSAIARYLLAVA